MPDPTTLQAEIDGLHAKATDPSLTGVFRDFAVDRFRRAAGDAWPTLSAALTEMRRKAEAFDAIAEHRVVFSRANRGIGTEYAWKATALDESVHLRGDTDLLTAIESALRGQKETT